MEAPYDFSAPAPQFTTTAFTVPTCTTARNSTPQLLLNIITSVAGYAAVAVEAADGRPPPPSLDCDLAHANRITGNTLAGVASWSTPQLLSSSGASAGTVVPVTSLGAWAGRVVRLRVEMVDAKLFATRVKCS
jgi:hypothetical protein